MTLAAKADDNMAILGATMDDITEKVPGPIKVSALAAQAQELKELLSDFETEIIVMKPGETQNF